MRTIAFTATAGATAATRIILMPPRLCAAGGLRRRRIRGCGARPGAGHRPRLRRTQACARHRAHPCRCGPRAGGTGSRARLPGLAGGHLPRRLCGTVLRDRACQHAHRPVPPGAIPGKSHRHRGGGAGGHRCLAARQPRGEDDERDVWRFIQQGRAGGLTIHAGLGREDRFGARHRILAAALRPCDTDVIPGGHDWPTWHRLWENFLDARFRANP